MELTAVLFMIVAGAAVALVASRALRHLDQPEPEGPPPPPEEIARAILAEFVPGAPRVVDVAGWATHFAAQRAPADREALLDGALERAAGDGARLPASDHVRLAELCFALGLRLAQLEALRHRRGIRIVDPPGRPQRPGSPERPPSGEARRKWLRVLEIDGGQPTRREIVSAYRRLAARYHPDRHLDASPDEQGEAAERFIEVTRAYERLLDGLRD